MVFVYNGGNEGTLITIFRLYCRLLKKYITLCYHSNDTCLFYNYFHYKCGTYQRSFYTPTTKNNIHCILAILLYVSAVRGFQQRHTYLATRQLFHFIHNLSTCFVFKSILLNIVIRYPLEVDIQKYINPNKFSKCLLPWNLNHMMDL